MWVEGESSSTKAEKWEELSVHGELMGMRRELPQPCRPRWTQRAPAVSQALMFQLRSGSQLPLQPSGALKPHLPLQSVRSLGWKHLEAPSILPKPPLLKTPRQAGLFLLYLSKGGECRAELCLGSHRERRYPYVVQLSSIPSFRPRLGCSCSV